MVVDSIWSCRNVAGVARLAPVVLTTEGRVRGVDGKREEGLKEAGAFSQHAVNLSWPARQGG